MISEKDLIRIGAEARLAELKAQATALERFIKGQSFGVTIPQDGGTADDRPRKLHWTQRPENKARLARILRKAQRARRG